MYPPPVACPLTPKSVFVAVRVPLPVVTSHVIVPLKLVIVGATVSRTFVVVLVAVGRPDLSLTTASTVHVPSAVISKVSFGPMFISPVFTLPVDTFVFPTFPLVVAVPVTI